MKSTATINQEELEQEAIDSMIAYEKNLIPEQEMGEAITRALHHYGNKEGHREIVLKGWIIATIYALDSSQLKDLDRVAFIYLNEPIMEAGEEKQCAVTKYSDNTDRENRDRVYVIRTFREMVGSAAYKSGNWEVVTEHIAPAPGDGGAHLYAIHSENVRPGEWIFDETGNYIAERIDY